MSRFSWLEIVRRFYFKRCKRRGQPYQTILKQNLRMFQSHHLRALLVACLDRKAAIALCYKY